MHLGVSSSFLSEVKPSVYLIFLDLKLIRMKLLNRWIFELPLHSFGRPLKIHVVASLELFGKLLLYLIIIPKFIPQGLHQCHFAYLFQLLFISIEGMLVLQLDHLWFYVPDHLLPVLRPLKEFSSFLSAGRLPRAVSAFSLLLNSLVHIILLKDGRLLKILAGGSFMGGKYWAFRVRDCDGQETIILFLGWENPLNWLSGQSRGSLGWVDIQVIPQVVPTFAPLILLKLGVFLQLIHYDVGLELMVATLTIIFSEALLFRFSHWLDLWLVDCQVWLYAFGLISFKSFSLAWSFQSILLTNGWQSKLGAIFVQERWSSLFRL